MCRVASGTYAQQADGGGSLGAQLALHRWLNSVLSAQLIVAALSVSPVPGQSNHVSFSVGYVSCIFISV